MMAAIMGIPTLVMDSNALPGFTNRRLARFVDKAALTFDEALPFFGKKGVVTGNPVRKDFFGIEPKVRTDVFHILIFGGSQGARAINNAVTDSLAEIAELNGKISFTHQTGERDFEKIRELYNRTAFSYADVRPFITDMVSEFAKADVVICRAGATTCAELAAAGKAAIMIPLPTAADDHQRKNAEAMERAGAAKMVLQRDLNGKKIADEIRAMVADPIQITKREAAAKLLGRADAAEQTADIIGNLAKHV
jgi:UDP-N-acetylglucosamine--N-acetylmuramyl-(pentapeptide) pyrophosphoryl-undecaprenol N-acetylglucosamine transferase